MPPIQQLDPHIADLIAAGEVVERPASVVKELMENAIDAGATKLTVEIQHGGMTLIRVTDNGSGIPPEQTATAFLRHATSKISTEYDLEAIGTLGFRGEALAAIAAVSRTELLTRVQGADMGTSLSIEGGVVLAQEEAGCPEGTTMVVRDLFFNTPARLKFMKKDAAEGAAVFGYVQKLALSHPEVGVKFLRDSKQDLLTAGDGTLRSAIYSVFGRDLALGLTPVTGSGEDISVTGFTSLPTCCRGTRGYQHFFVNGRYVKSRTMMAAVEEAYANQKMVGKFPACVLHVTTKLGAVDVNVHPTKTEVKFSSDKKIFDGVYYAVKSSLEGGKSRPTVVMPTAPVAPKDTVTANQTTVAQALAETLSKPKTSLPLRDCTAPKMVPPHPVGADAHIRPPSEPAHPVGDGSPVPPATKAETTGRPPNTPTKTGMGVSVSREMSVDSGTGNPSPTMEQPYAPPTKIEPPHPVGDGSPVPSIPEPSPIPTPEPSPEPIPWRLAGEVLNTYIIVEQGDKVLFIDKHAAHERMHFERMKAEGYTPMVQSLLMPAVLTLPAEEGAVLLQNIPLLNQFGFEVEDFGGGALIVRGAPDHVDVGEIEEHLADIAQRILSTGTADPQSARDALLHSMSCKAAIKGGQKNGTPELMVVASAVMDGKVKYCPHGRPVAIEMTRGQMEKQFKRA